MAMTVPVLGAEDENHACIVGTTWSSCSVYCGCLGTTGYSCI
jgi:hypothetical protein